MCWPCKKKDAPKETERKLKANTPSYNAQFHYAANYIKTSKYNVVTFLPKNLFEQFQRLANFYFLILMVLQLIPQISSLTPLTTILPLVAVLTVTAMKDAVDDLCIPEVSSLKPWTTVLPLAFVLLVTAVKDAYDDIQRHRSDNQVNNRKSLVVRQGKLVEEKWQNVCVGDIIRMESDHFVAADLMMLTSSEPHGLCYIETAELDGETNLKARQALTETSEMGEDLAKIGAFDGEVVCEPPNNRLNSFEGQLKYKNKMYSLDNDKMLLRGCVLRNTKWCFGLVVFAGRDTKLMMNSGKTTFKRTSLDRFLNVLIIGIVIFLLAMCVICTICSGIWESVYGYDFQIFLPWDPIVPKNSVTGSVAFVAFLVFFSYAILLNTVVPISLYVSVEIIRFYHSWWINWDQEMYYAFNDTPARARTTTLNEELGQIQYIFSDKTGTLTQNIMTFNKCTINGKLYGDVLDEKGRPMETKAMKPLDFSWNKWADEKFRFFDKNLVDDTRKGEKLVQMFWRLLALCHTVMPDSKNGKLVYQAQSPDEEALTMAARAFGFVFKSRTPNSITIEFDGKEETYELLCILDFNNFRKRMSVLLKKENKVFLFCKGADTMVFERLAKESNNRLHNVTQSHLDKFANEGLRTLCLAYKEVPLDFFNAWKKRQHEASVALQNRQEKLDAVYEEIEKDLILLGATAIEDKLQDGVPETIANLADANIKIWVLTGDKQETAINIGYSCRLLTEDMRDVFIIDGDKFDIVQTQLDKIKKQIEDWSMSASTNASARKNLTDAAENGGLVPVMVSSNQHAGSSGQIADNEPLEGFALVINGHSLTHALDSRLEMTFLEIGCACKAVICCRVTPLQKALVVDLVKRNKKAVTLAVGDGANDVSMIKMAHIGVGISGQEGMQAVLASDYSIAQFRFLERLLLVHGRWSYFRMSKFLRYFFYKNFAFTLVHFWYAFYCAYSAMTIYDPLFIACYNLFFTALPVLALGIFDQDVNDKSSLKYPRLYIPGQYNLYFNMRIFVYSVFHGIFSSLVLFFIPMATLSENTMQNGLNLDGLYTLGFTIFSSLVVTVTAQIAIDTAYWTTANHIVIWGSLAFYFLVAILFYQAVPYHAFRQSGYGVAFMSMQTANYWFCIMLITVILIMPVIGLRFFWFDTQPTLSDRIRVKQNIRRLQSRMSELPLRSFRTASGRSRRGSTRSGYAFAHQQGFGDLITKGIVIQRLAPIKESPVRESAGADDIVSVN